MPSEFDTYYFFVLVSARFYTTLHSHVYASSPEL